MNRSELEALSRRGRSLVLRTVHHSGAGHVGGPLSAMDMLVALYFSVLDIRPDQPDWPDRDRFILSKGHCAVGLYSVLAMRGYLPEAELATFDKGDSRLQGHPDMLALPGLDASTGSLGQGLSFGAGVALAARMAERPFHTFVMLGDGEIQEGMVWEAAHVARRYGLGNLTAIVDYNGLQQYGWAGSSDRGDRRDPWHGFEPGGVFEAFGWRVTEIDGHDHGQFIDACQMARADGSGDRPTAIVARTVKGRGVSFTEGNYLWHAAVPDAEQFAAAAAELGYADEEVSP
jgi:transketolase